MASIKRILVPLAGGETGSAALDFASRFSRPFQAHVSVIYFKFDPEMLFVPLGDYPLVSAEAIQDVAAKQDAEVATWKKRFEDWVGRERLSPEPATPQGSATWREETGREMESLSHWSKLSDLIVVTRSESGRTRLIAETVLFDAGRPVLLATPESSKNEDVMVVAWDGSRESAHAITAALPFLVNAREIVVFTRREIRKPEAQPEDMVAYLADHGIKARADHVLPSATDVAEELLQRCERLGAGLLVMGAYSHNRFREAVFGGVTRRVLGEARVPVLMCH